MNTLPKSNTGMQRHKPETDKKKSDIATASQNATPNKSLS